MKMWRNKAILTAVLAVAIVAWLVWSKTPRAPTPAVQDVPSPEAVPYVSQSNASVVAEKSHPMRGTFVERAVDFTETEKEGFTNLFVTKLKPAAEKWFLTYSNRVPFNLSELTPDKLVRRVGTRVPDYSFVIGDITFDVKVYDGTAKVAYLGSRQGLMAMNAVPTLTGPPDLSMPVTREQVLGLVEADSGIRFPQDEVTLTPTGESGSLMGGANAELGKEVNNPLYREFGGTNYTLVFGPDGKLNYYLRSEIATSPKKPVKTR